MTLMRRLRSFARTVAAQPNRSTERQLGKTAGPNDAHGQKRVSLCVLAYNLKRMIRIFGVEALMAAIGT